jgi:hypothetical protein
VHHPFGVRTLLSDIFLPDYVLRNPGVVALITGSNGIYNDDDLCLFICLAVHRGAPVSVCDYKANAGSVRHEHCPFRLL